MAIYLTSLNSGSNGNCYYIGNDTEAVLIDAGISCRETEKRMSRLNLSLSKVKAIFVSHEHGDHIRGIEVLSKKHNIPVYISAKTLQNTQLNLSPLCTRHFLAFDTIVIGGLAIHAFPKFHDAADPYSFTISNGEITVGVFTDIGHCCEQVISNFKKCNAVFLESNYDEAMLSNGSYPYYLKKRISSNRGHLSNRQALELFLNHKHEQLSHLFLSHLSKENNCPKLTSELFNKHAVSTEIIVAPRDAETEIYEISNRENDLSAIRQNIYTQVKMNNTGEETTKTKNTQGK